MASVPAHYVLAWGEFWKEPRWSRKAGPGQGAGGAAPRLPTLKPGQQKETKKWGDGEIGAEGELKWPAGRSEPGPMSPGWT